MTIDERLEVLTLALELEADEGEAQRLRISELMKVAEEDGRNIRALARIAESHEKRISDLER